MSCLCALPVRLRGVSRHGTGSAYACVAGVDEAGLLYQTVVDTHHYENGSFTVTFSITGGPINEAGASCGALTSESTEDPNFAYGAELSLTTAYSGPVSLESIVAAATAALDYGAEDDPPWIVLDRHSWFSNDFSLASPASSCTAGETSTVAATQVRFELSGYMHLAVNIYLQYKKLSDNSDGTLATVTLTPAAPVSGWISAPAPDLDDGWYVAAVAVRILPYTTTSVPL